jgi:hypothetical protein
MDPLVHIQLSQAVLEEQPDLCLVASKWRQLIHSIFLSLVSYNLCLCHQDTCHDGSDGVWFDIKGYWGLVVFEDK